MIDENNKLKQELSNLKTQSATVPDSSRIMEALQKGKKFQEESNQFLEELDRED